MAHEPFPHPDGDVAVAVVAYRVPDVLARCLESFAQHRPARVGEVVVVDNTEEPEPPTAGDRFPWIRYDAARVNLHYRRGINRAVGLTTKPYVLLLNADTYVTDGDSVAKLAEVLDRDPKVGFAGPRMAGDDGKLAPQGERIPGLAYLLALKSYLNAVWPGNPIARHQSRAGASRDVSGPVETVSTAAMLVRRDEFLAVGGFDERATIYWEEPELAQKLRRKGQHGYYRADAFAYHSWRQGGSEHDTAPGTQRLFDEAMALYYREYLGTPGRLLWAALERWQQIVRRVRR